MRPATPPSQLPPIRTSPLPIALPNITYYHDSGQFETFLTEYLSAAGGFYCRKATYASICIAAPLYIVTPSCPAAPSCHQHNPIWLTHSDRTRNRSNYEKCPRKIISI